MSTVLKVENLSKLYRLGEVGTGTISHDLNRWWARARGKEDPYSLVGQTNDRSQKAESDYVWALKDINFEVEQGEILGIIGRNGAGKSTLLKILSQITSPTTGEIKTKGRIASLLEVGTGMHPEMTARENIYLNGAILGMTKKEIAAKFDEIIDFSGCTMYVDTPLKRFSSGMRVRLGFAVAAFLEPEILIVDEVLAVGDAEFQKKAIGKMKDISSGGGRTVLFVSHNMASISNLCKRVLVMEQGRISFVGETKIAINKYLSTSNIGFDESIKFKENIETNKNKSFLFCGLQIFDQMKKKAKLVLSGQKISIVINYQVKKPIYLKGMRVLITDSTSVIRIVMNGAFVSNLIPLEVRTTSESSFVFTIDKLPLPPGCYDLTISAFGIEGVLDEIENAYKLTVEAGDFYGFGKIPEIKEGVYIPYKFEINRLWEQD